MHANVIDIHLYGKAKQIAGTSKLQLAASNLQVLFSGLVSRFGHEFDQFIRETNFEIGRKKLGKDAKEDDAFHEDQIKDSLEGVKEIHLYPRVKGSGRTGRIIAGVVLIVVGVVMYYFPATAPYAQNVIGAGVGLLLGGLFMPKNQQQADKPDERASFVFNQAVNTIEQGGPVPLVYGRTLTGSTVLSSGIDAERLAHYTSGYNNGSAPNDIFWDRQVE